MRDPTTTAKPKLILVIEDDPDLALTMADCLEFGGYSAAIASDGREALDRLRDGLRPVLILLDMMMPVLDGWGFREEQLRMAPDVAQIPIVAITADGDGPRKASSIKAIGFLAKPVKLERLLGEVSRIGGPPE